jgi:formamidopyrimidine-DNA glycosylase
LIGFLFSKRFELEEMELIQRNNKDCKEKKFMKSIRRRERERKKLSIPCHGELAYTCHLGMMGMSRWFK